MFRYVYVLVSKALPDRHDVGITTDLTSHVRAAEAVCSGLCAAVLPQIALVTLDPKSVHRLPIPDTFTLCLAWTARNAGTRPARVELIGEIESRVALTPATPPRRAGVR